MRRAAILSLTLLAGCFGGLENRPLEPGPTEVFGTIEGALSPGAFVSVVGRPELSARVDAGGRFTIRGVPSGEVRLAASDGDTRAASAIVTLYQDRPLEVRFDMRPALRIVGRILLEETFDDGTQPTVSIEGLPVEVETDLEGRFLLPGLFADCHKLIADHPGFARWAVETCGAEGETVPVDHQLRHDSVHQSAVCGPCDRDDQCESGFCAAVDHLCLQPCDMHACPRGFECVSTGDRLACRPPFATCPALRDLVRRTGCDTSASCGLRGHDDGVCAPDGHCSIRCDVDAHCPEGFVCHGDPGHQLCTP